MVALYIYDFDGQAVNRIELFNDEKISVTSSVQNFNDIGKLFTDYSQTFTVPASKHNNTIFKHWYESAVGLTDEANPLNVDFAFDHRIKYYGYIEIDSIPFRDGKFVMQKANKKNNFIESYTINFVGNLVQLKDKFLEDKLNTLLDENGISYYDQLNFTYDLFNVGSRIEPTTTAAVYFPLIGSTRRFEYNTGVAANDITLLSGAIDFTELFPSINVSVILSYIQQAYGIEFTGEFLNSQTFSKLHLYCKNAEVMSCKTQLDRITFRLLPELTERFTIPFFYVPTFTMTVFPFNTLPVFRQNIILNITTTCTNYNLYVYNNGELYFSNLNLNGNHQQLVIVKQGFFADTFNFEFFINSDLPVSFDYSATLANNYQLLTGANPPYVVSSKNYNSLPVVQTSTALLSIQKYIPDITVSDFITGLVKMFNLIIVPISETKFEFIPVELWYQNGNEIDLTEFVEAEDIEIGKPNLFKKLDFKHEKSENILNTNFRDFNDNQEYGNLFFDNPNSAFTTNYEIKTPFEDVMWERTTGTDFLTTTMWNKDLNPYTPKPVLMYDNGGISFGDVTSDYIYLKDATTNLHLDSYRRFSNEIQLGASDLSYLQTLNWGVENSVWNLTFAPNGLYQQFYSQYINNLYNQRTRVLKVKAHFGTFLTTSLKINDRIILSNKRYLINTMTTDLTSGDVSLELINDFRDVSQETTYFRYSNIMGLTVDNTAQEVELIIYRNNYDTFDVKLSTDFLSYPITTGNDTDILLNVTIPANATAADRSDFVILEYFKNGVGTIIQIPVLQNA
jgi:hypothetical protein